LIALDLENNYITEDGWAVISNLLCNTSSINSTRYSNHTLRCLGESTEEIPLKVAELLKMNNLKDKDNIARMKVDLNHFSGSLFDTKAIHHNARIRLLMLPDIIAWLGKNPAGLSAVNTILSSLPVLFQNDHQGEVTTSQQSSSETLSLSQLPNQPSSTAMHSNARSMPMTCHQQSSEGALLQKQVVSPRKPSNEAMSFFTGAAVVGAIVLLFSLLFLVIIQSVPTET
jgi:hypothetical protein